MHKIFSTGEQIAMVDVECRQAGIGCVDCKKLFAQNLNTHLEPFRACRMELSLKGDYVKDVLKDGAKRAGAIARQTIAEAKEAIGLPLLPN